MQLDYNNVIDFGKVKHNFKQFMYFLSGLEKLVDKTSTSKFKINNSSLKAAASRVQVPKPFDKYIQYIKENTGLTFNENLKFTVDEVRDEDRRIIKDFSVSNFDLTKINVDSLIKSGIQSFKDLNLLEDSIKVTSMPIGVALKRYPNNTSAGFPTFRRKDNDYAFNDALEWGQNFISNPKLFDILKQPTAVFHRFQFKAKTINNKTQLVKKIRPVWGVSYRVLGFEGFMFRNLIDKYDYMNSLNPDAITPVGKTKDQISKTLIYNIRKRKRKIVSSDYTRFDSYVPSFMWSLFYAIFRELSDDSITDEHIKNMMAFHNYTPYCWNSNVLSFQKRGVPSGCLITSFFNTWVNRTIVNYAFYEYSSGRKFAGANSYCLGDDLLFVEDGLTLAHYLSVVKRFNMIVDAEKVEISQYWKPFSFLGYTWDSKDRPTEPIDWYIARLCLPSRFYRNYDIPVSYLQTYRAISLCMGLYKGMEIFEYLIGYKDFVYKKLIDDYKSNKDVYITYIGEDMRYYKLGIPLSKIFDEGWSAF